MKRTTIIAPEDLLRKLRILAAERGTSMADLIREALEEKVSSQQPRLRSLGIGASGHSDTSRRTADERPVPRTWR
jgi:plasmid stability protein